MNIHSDDPKQVTCPKCDTSYSYKYGHFHSCHSLTAEPKLDVYPTGVVEIVSDLEWPTEEVTPILEKLYQEGYEKGLLAGASKDGVAYDAGRKAGMEEIYEAMDKLPRRLFSEGGEHEYIDTCLIYKLEQAKK